MIQLSGRPLIIFDTETTGTSPELDRIVQIALIKLYQDGTRTEWSSLINPEMEIPKEAAAIHGIKTSDVDRGQAPTFKDLARKLYAGFVGCDVGGFNVQFDVKMLVNEFKRVGMNDPTADARCVDAARIFHSREKRTLTAACKFYLGEDLEDAHSAVADTNASLRVLEAQLQRYEDLPRTVEELHTLFFETPEPPFIDVEKRLVWRNGKPTLNFGKFNGVSLDRCGRQYLNWILNNDFSPTVKSYARRALEEM